MITPLECPRCKTLNDYDAKYCKKCLIVLDPEKALEIEETKTKDDKTVKTMMQRMSTMQQTMQEMFAEIEGLREQKIVAEARK